MTQYFSRYPNIIRTDNKSIAVIDNDVQHEDLVALGSDIFMNFGIGSRSVSKILIPVDFDLGRFFNAIVGYGEVIHHHKYKNNYDYSNAIYLLGTHPFLTNNFLILREDTSIDSRISCVHYEYYRSDEDLKNRIDADKERIECIASRVPIEGIDIMPFGTCHYPGLRDYEGGTDTLKFLIGLKEVI